MAVICGGEAVRESNPGAGCKCMLFSITPALAVSISVTCSYRISCVSVGESQKYLTTKCSQICI